MTRINIGIPPANLTDQHLLAELRELPRIPNKVKKYLKENRLDLLQNIPEQFTLGTGHVRFFYNKLMYIYNRYPNLHHEYIKRGFYIDYYDDLFVFGNVNRYKYFSNYTVQQKDIQLIKSRIATRIRESSQQPRYYKEPIEKEEYITNILKFN